jgi:hypothetical protein
VKGLDSPEALIPWKNNSICRIWDSCSGGYDGGDDMFLKNTG